MHGQLGVLEAAQGPVSPRADAGVLLEAAVGVDAGLEVGLADEGGAVSSLVVRGTAAMDGASVGSGMPLATTPWVRTYWPVSMVERAGMHTVFWL